MHITPPCRSCHIHVLLLWLREADSLSGSVIYACCCFSERSIKGHFSVTFCMYAYVVSLLFFLVALLHHLSFVPCLFWSCSCPLCVCVRVNFVKAIRRMVIFPFFSDLSSDLYVFIFLLLV